MLCELITTESHAAELLAMMKKCGIESTGEMMAWAFSVLGWAVEESERGRVIATIDREANAFDQLHMPVLEAIRRRA